MTWDESSPGERGILCGQDENGKEERLDLGASKGEK